MSALASALHTDNESFVGELSAGLRAIEEANVVSDAEINACATLAALKTMFAEQLAPLGADVIRSTQMDRLVDYLEYIGVTNSEINAISTGWTGLYALVGSGSRPSRSKHFVAA